MQIGMYDLQLDEFNLPKLVKSREVRMRREMSYHIQNRVELELAFRNAFPTLVLGAEERVCMFALNMKGDILACFEVSHGGVNGSYCQPQSLLMRALYAGASNIAIAHNHPSNDVSPSNEDTQITKRLAECCKLVGIQLMDHLILGRDSCFSFQESGLM